MTRECAKCGHRNCNHSYLEATGKTVDDRKFTPEGHLIDDSGLFKSPQSIDTTIAIIERRINDLTLVIYDYEPVQHRINYAVDQLKDLLAEIQALKEDK
jgi:hypothetical protein